MVTIEYDPNRTAGSRFPHYLEGEQRYILAPVGLGGRDAVQPGQDAVIRIGNAMPMRDIPVGTAIHCVEMLPGEGAQMARSAGSRAARGQGGRLRHHPPALHRDAAGAINCRATVGEVGNAEHELIKIGKAGRNRWKGVHPTRARP